MHKHAAAYDVLPTCFIILDLAAALPGLTASEAAEQVWHARASRNRKS